MHGNAGSSGDWGDQEGHSTAAEMKIVLGQHMEDIQSLTRNRKKQKTEPELATTKSDSPLHLGPLTALFYRSLGVGPSLPSLESLFMEEVDDSGEEQDLAGEEWEVLVHVTCNLQKKDLGRSWMTPTPTQQFSQMIPLSVLEACTIALSIGLQSWQCH